MGGCGANVQDARLRVFGGSVPLCLGNEII